MSSAEKKNEPNKLRSYTSDLLALETHFLKAVRKQRDSDAVKDEKVIELLHEIDKMTAGHTESLKLQVERLGGSVTSEIKSKIASFAGSVTGIIDRARTDTVSKMLRDDYTALSLITIGYTMLHTHALAVEDHGLADVTQNHMANCTGMITEISKVVPLTVAKELIEDADRAEEIGRKALENTQAMWSPDVVNREPVIV